MKTYCIALARVVTDMVPDGEPYRADLGYGPTWISEERAVSLIWLNEGTEEDVAKAQSWVSHKDQADQGWQVFTFPVNEADPLGAAKQKVLPTR